MSMRANNICFITLLVLGILFLKIEQLYAQVSSGGIPLTVSQEYTRAKLKSSLQSSSYTVHIKDLDKNLVKNELDSMRNSCVTCNSGFYYGKEIDLNLDFFKEAEFFSTENGEKVWLLKLTTSEAEGFQVIFDKFNLKEESKLYIYNEDLSMILGAFTSNNNRECETFLTQYITGNTIYIEYSEPENMEESSLISISKIVYIFDKCFSQKGPFSEEGSSSCQTNTSCSLGKDLDIEIKSTAIILEKRDGKYWGTCSGALINRGDYTDESKPYFLTSNHCYENDEDGSFSDVKNWLFLFRHEAKDCNSNGSDVTSSTSKSALGANVAARDAKSKETDFLLLQLNNTVGQIKHFDVVFAGWSEMKDDVSNSKRFVGIHHPKGDVKKVMTTTKSPKSIKWNDNKNEDHWDVTWEEGGFSEPGSSGSPLFNDKHQVVGVLHGSAKSTCDLIKPTAYGKLSDAYTQPFTGFRDHLPFTAYSAFIPTIYDYTLDLTFKTEPENIKVASNVYLNASIPREFEWATWYFIVNSDPNDYTEYPPSSNKRKEYVVDTKNKKSARIGPISFVEEGYYRVSVYVVTSEGYQAQKTFYVNVSTDGCIKAGFEFCNNNEQYYFQVGEPIKIRQWAYIEGGEGDFPSSGNNCPSCSQIGKFAGRCVPEYDGIKNTLFKILPTPMRYGVGKIYAERYSSTHYAQDKFKLPYGDSYSPYTTLFRLSYTGVYDVIFEYYGGYFDYKYYDANLGYGPTGKLMYRHDENVPQATIKKRIVLVDCNSEVTISKVDDPLLINKFENNSADEYNLREVKAGVINLNAMTLGALQSGEYDVQAFKRIVFKPGVVIKSGAKLKARVLGCPKLCPENNPKNVAFETSAIENDIMIPDINAYPNPTSGGINLDIPLNIKVASIEVYDLSGKCIIQNKYNTNPSELDLSGNLPGVYILRIYYDGGLYDKRIILE